MKRIGLLLFPSLVFICFFSIEATANLDLAPPSFGYRQTQVVPVDVTKVEVFYEFNYSTSKATARAIMHFTMNEAGYPLFDLVPNPTSLKLDGTNLNADAAPVINDPNEVTQFRVLTEALEAATTHSLEITYNVPEVTFSGGSVSAGFWMSDLTTGGRDFIEQYAPGNYEYDQIQYIFHVNITGTNTEHRIFTNGDINAVTSNSWTIQFPDYFTASSIFFHLTAAGRFFVEEFTYEGTEATIPVTVYSSSSSRTNQAASNTRSIMRELESTYGGFAHNKLVIYVTSSGGGMEYCGATMTSLGALGHELTHSWFARSVMPASGNSGWIDEAIASWRDNGYPRARSAPNRSPVNLGGFSDYRRHTTYSAYSSGATLMSEFDYLFRDQGGLRTVLSGLFSERSNQVISTPFFHDFLERTTGVELDQIFERYVYGRSEMGVDFSEDDASVLKGSHPRPYTKEELRRFR